MKNSQRFMGTSPKRLQEYGSSQAAPVNRSEVPLPDRKKRHGSPSSGWPDGGFSREKHGSPPGGVGGRTGGHRKYVGSGELGRQDARRRSSLVSRESVDPLEAPDRHVGWE